MLLINIALFNIPAGAAVPSGVAKDINLVGGPGSRNLFPIRKCGKCVSFYFFQQVFRPSRFIFPLDKTSTFPAHFRFPPFYYPPCPIAAAAALHYCSRPTQPAGPFSGNGLHKSGWKGLPEGIYCALGSKFIEMGLHWGELMHVDGWSGRFWGFVFAVMSGVPKKLDVGRCVTRERIMWWNLNLSGLFCTLQDLIALLL